MYAISECIHNLYEVLCKFRIIVVGIATVEICYETAIFLLLALRILAEPCSEFLS